MASEVTFQKIPFELQDNGFKSQICQEHTINQFNSRSDGRMTESVIEA